jgi:hypothetical protein
MHVAYVRQKIVKGNFNDLSFFLQFFVTCSITMKTGIKSKRFLIIALAALPGLWAACKSDKHPLTAQDSIAVTDSVKLLVNNISQNLGIKGPVIWLDYFDNSPQFFMAADGQLSFTNYQSAKAFIRDTLVKNMSKIMLKWNGLRVDPLTRQFAAIGSNFHEDITLTNRQVLSFDGYFTGIAILTPQGWKLKNAHWSMKKPAK